MAEGPAKGRFALRGRISFFTGSLRSPSAPFAYRVAPSWARRRTSPSVFRHRHCCGPTAAANVRARSSGVKRLARRLTIAAMKPGFCKSLPNRSEPTAASFPRWSPLDGRAQEGRTGRRREARFGSHHGERRGGSCTLLRPPWPAGAIKRGNRLRALTPAESGARPAKRSSTCSRRATWAKATPRPKLSRRGRSEPCR
jgi:hypothetical protein